MTSLQGWVKELEERDCQRWEVAFWFVMFAVCAFVTCAMISDRDHWKAEAESWKSKYEKLVPVKVTSHSGMPDQYGRFSKTWIAKDLKNVLAQSVKGK